jgi:DeoR/GlpR family transcriptional regulator of sugar metabolism
MATGRLKIDIRRQAILEQLKRDGQVFVSDLSEKLGITPVTIRNDLDTLAMEGRLERIQGGAILKPVTAYADSRDSLPIQPEKQAIAQAVLDYVQDGDTLFINSGRTALAAAQMLSQRKKLNIVTNSLEAANCLSHQADIRLILLGGELNAIYGFTYGGDALEQLGRYQSDWSILSVDGIHPDHGITTYHADEAIVDRTMIARAKKTIIVADHNKIGRVGFSHICNIDHRHILITDNDCNPMMLDHLKNSGLSLHIAQR